MDLYFEYFRYFDKYWIPIYRKQILECKFNNEEEALREIYDNINKNWNLKEYKGLILKSLGIDYIAKRILSDEEVKNEKFKQYKNLIFLCLKKQGLLSEEDKYYDVGLIGLTRGINTYSPDKGYKDSTYYYVCIKNEIGHALTLENTKKRNYGKQDLSLNRQLTINSEDTLEDLIEDKKINIENEVLLRERDEIIKDCMSKLKPDRQKVLKLFYGIDCEKLPARLIAENMNMTSSAVRQKLEKARRELKKLLIQNGIEGY